MRRNVGIVLIVLGAVILAANLLPVLTSVLAKLWPLVLIIAGVALLAPRRRGS